MSEAVQAWINEATAHPAVVACGVRTVGAAQVKSRRQDLTEAQVTEAVKELSEALYFLQQNQFYAERLWWTFEGGQICCVFGRGKVMAVLVVNQDAVNSPEIERLLAACPLTVPEPPGSGGHSAGRAADA
jgi:hypothetical protein